MNRMTDPYREWDVAYLLGSLSVAEREEYERHLDRCAACRGEVTALSGLPGVMSALPRAQAADLLSPGTSSPAARILRLRNAARGSRRTAYVWIVVALIAVAIAVVLAISVLSHPRRESHFHDADGRESGLRDPCTQGKLDAGKALS